MRIKKFKIENFRGFEQLELEFSSTSNVVVLISQNGGGKTSILDALRLSLGQIVCLIVKKINNQYDKNFEDLITKKDIKSGADQYVVEALIEETPENQIVTRNTTETLESEFHAVSSGGLHNTLNNEDSNIPIIAFYNSSLYSLSGAKLPGFKYKQELALYNSMNAPFTKFIDFVTWYIYEKKNSEVLKTPSKAIQTINDIMLRFLDEADENQFDNLGLIKKMDPPNDIFDIAKENFSLCINKNGILLDVGQLSAGEKQMLMLVIDIARRLILANPSLENPLLGTGIVLIDEIEQHLHPKWQRNIIPALTQNFPNIQFIVTTHSPQVVSHIPRECVLILENNSLRENNFYNEGRDNNFILEDIFGLSRFTAEYEAKLDEFYKMVDERNAENAEIILNELAEKWSEFDAEIILAKLYFQDLLNEVEA